MREAPTYNISKGEILARTHPLTHKRFYVPRPGWASSVRGQVDILGLDV